MKCLKLFIAAVAMVAMLSCGGGGGSAASKVAVKQMEYLYNCDVDGLLGLCNMKQEKREQFKPMVEEKLVKSVEKELSKVDGFKGAKAIEEVVSEDGTKATITVEITFGDGSTKTEEVKVVNIDGKWMLPDPMANK